MPQAVEMVLHPTGSIGVDESLTRPGAVVELYPDGSTVPMLVTRTWCRLSDRHMMIEVVHVT